MIEPVAYWTTLISGLSAFVVLLLRTIELLEKSLTMIQHCEVVNDMKDKQKLLKRILLLLLKDESIRKQFLALSKEVNWKKVYLTKGDKYNFRGKYYKADYRLFEY